MNNPQKQCILVPVMPVNESEKLRRLKAEDEIGNAHIAVENHIASVYPLHWHNFF